MNPRLALFLFLVFVVAAQALTLEQEASFWASEGENATVTDVAGDGSILLVRVKGVESAFLKKTDSDYAAVSSDDEIRALIEKYQKHQFDNTNLVANIQVAKDKYDIIGYGLKNCSYGVTEYVLHKVNAWPFSLVYRARVDFPTEYSGYISLNATHREFNATVQSATAGIEEMYSASKAGSIPETFAGVSKTRTGLASIRTNYEAVYGGYYNITYKYFPYAFWHGGKAYTCDSTSNVTIKLDEILALIPEFDFKDTSALFESISTATRARLGTAQEKKLVATRSERVELLQAKIANLSTKFSALGGGALTALENEVKNLNDSKNSVDFDSKMQEAESKVGVYESLYSDYSKSVAALNNATTQIKSASKKYSANDERVVEMQKTTQALQASLKKSETAVRNGNLTAVQFQSIAQNATSIAVRAAKLGPKEGQIDLMTIGGIIVLVLALVGAIWYFKKSKGEGGGKTPVPIDVRDLVNQKQSQPPGR